MRDRVTTSQVVICTDFNYGSAKKNWNHFFNFQSKNETLRIKKMAWMNCHSKPVAVLSPAPAPSFLLFFVFSFRRYLFSDMCFYILT